MSDRPPPPRALTPVRAVGVRPVKAFEPGDLVQLKSGGPTMTVAKVDNINVYVVWFDKNDEPKLQTFPSHTLKSVGEVKA